MPFFFGNGFFALTAQAAPAINTITYTQGAIASPDPVFSREPVLFNAGTTEAEGLTYVWYFGDGESEVGQSVTHLYDAPGTVQVALRLYTGSTEVVARTQNITVQPLRLPADYTTMTEAQKAGQRDRWPYARAARLDGPGAYVAGSNVRFNARFSERNPAAGGLWNPVNTYQWTISGAQGTVAGPIGVNRATDPSGAYSFSAQTPGWYTVVLRTHHLNQAPSDPVPVYDETKYAFLVVPTAAEAGNAAFDAALNSTQQDLDVGSQPEPLPILNYRAVGTVSGGLAPFTYIWNYPNDGKTMEGEPDFITITSPAPTANRTTTLNAEFTKSGTKRIYLTVRDATYREVHKPITYIITNSAEGITPFSPTLDVAATPSPLSISMVEANNQPLTLTLPAGLSAQPQTFVFRATASNGKPPYVFQWTPTGLAPDVPCTKEASFEQCTYRFSSFGPHSVAVTVTDDTSPVQSVTFTQNIMLLSAGEEDSPDGSGGTGDNAAGGSGTGGSGTGGTDSGTGGTGDAGGTAASGTLDPRASNYGLSSAFTRVGLGQDDDLKGSIANIINIVLGFLGIIAVIIVLAGGFKIMTAAGDEDKVSSGKQIITAGVIGLAVILAAWGIAEFVVGNLVSATT